MACHESERKIRMLAKLRSDYPYQRQESKVSNQDMKYPYRRARTVFNNDVADAKPYRSENRRNPSTEVPYM